MVKLNQITATTYPTPEPWESVFDQNATGFISDGSVVRFTTKTRAKVELRLYTVMGNKVTTLVKSVLSPGTRPRFLK